MKDVLCVMCSSRYDRQCGFDLYESRLMYRKSRKKERCPIPVSRSSQDWQREEGYVVIHHDGQVYTARNLLMSRDTIC